MLLNVSCPYPGCGKSFIAPPQSTTIMAYSETEYTHVKAACPHCENCLILFLAQLTSEQRLALNYQTIHSDEVPQFLRDGYDLLVEANQPTEEFEPIKLSPRQEAEIAKLGDVLDHMSDADLLDEFSLPPPKSNLPRKWA